MLAPGPDLLVHLMFSAWREPLTFELGKEYDGHPVAWRRWIDTSLRSPDDITDWRQTPAHGNSEYRVESRSLVVLLAEP